MRTESNGFDGQEAPETIEDSSRRPGPAVEVATSRSGLHFRGHVRQWRRRARPTRHPKAPMAICLQPTLSQAWPRE